MPLKSISFYDMLVFRLAQILIKLETLSLNMILRILLFFGGNFEHRDLSKKDSFKKETV